MLLLEPPETAPAAAAAQAEPGGRQSREALRQPRGPGAGLAAGASAARPPPPRPQPLQPPTSPCTAARHWLCRSLRARRVTA